MHKGTAGEEVEKAERNRWAAELQGILEEARLPICLEVAAVKDPDNAWRHAAARCARRAEPGPVSKDSKFHVDCIKTRRGIAGNVAQNEHLEGLPATGAVGVAPALLGE